MTALFQNPCRETTITSCRLNKTQRVTISSGILMKLLGHIICCVVGVLQKENPRINI